MGVNSLCYLGYSNGETFSIVAIVNEVCEVSLLLMSNSVS